MADKVNRGAGDRKRNGGLSSCSSVPVIHSGDAYSGLALPLEGGQCRTLAVAANTTLSMDWLVFQALCSLGASLTWQLNVPRFFW